MPRVSVLMSVYNDADYLPTAVDSILTQTFSDFEFIIINDASTDGSTEILTAIDDSRVILLHNEQNIGLTRSLNRGLAIAQGEYIARMDSDDIATPQRLAESVAWLDAHPHVGLLSGNATLIDPKNEVVRSPAYLHHAPHGYLRWALLWANRIYHMTVVLRKSVLDAHNLVYDPAYNTIEDHELWLRMAHVTSLYRSQEIWVQHRINPSGVSHRRREEQLRLQLEIIRRELAYMLGDTPDESALQTLFQNYQIDYQLTQPANYHAAAALLIAVHRHYTSQHQLTTEENDLINNDLIGDLYRLMASAKAGTARQVWGIWWQLLRFAPQEALSRHVFRRLFADK